MRTSPYCLSFAAATADGTAYADARGPRVEVVAKVVMAVMLLVRCLKCVCVCVCVGVWVCVDEICTSENVLSCSHRGKERQSVGEGKTWKEQR